MSSRLTSLLLASLVMAAPATNTSDFRALIPSGSWDSHMHILDPSFPLDPAAVYKPDRFYTSSDARTFERDVSGLSGVVIVQPSIYGYNNTGTLTALAQMGGPATARAVVAFDPATPGIAESLKQWDAQGVRGVRINLASGGGAAPPTEQLEATLRQYADLIRPLGWVLQIYTTLPVIQALEPVLSPAGGLGVRVCIDHMGAPNLTAPAYVASADPYDMPGFGALARLLESGGVWVKLSAAYRFSKAADGYSDALPVARELLRVAGPSRVVFATDWPHTRFEGLDISPWIRAVVYDLCQGDQALIDRVFRGNANELWSPAVPFNATA